MRIFILFSVLLLACEKNTDSTNTKTEFGKSISRLMVPVPEFNGDSALAFCQKQVNFGHRVPGTQSHSACGDFIVATLKRYKAHVTEQFFDATLYNGTVIKGRNIFAAFNPDIRKRILLAAHWDTRPFADQDEPIHHNTPIQGANDGASGVAVLLEIARVMAADSIRPAVGVDMIFFDVEDYGEPENWQGQRDKVNYCLGSQYWAKNKHVPGYQAYFGILFDMVGAKDAEFYFEGNSYQIAPSICELVWNTAASIGFGHIFIKRKTNMDLIDDHLFVSRHAGIPMIDIIEHGRVPGATFYPHWHKLSDTIDKLSAQTLKAVGQTTLAVLYSEPVQ